MFLADLVIMMLDWFDVFLNMDWLSKYRAVIDYSHKRVSLLTKSG